MGPKGFIIGIFFIIIILVIGNLPREDRSPENKFPRPDQTKGQALGYDYVNRVYKYNTPTQRELGITPKKTIKGSYKIEDIITDMIIDNIEEYIEYYGY